MDVVASLQSAIDIVGKLRALSKKIEDADFKMLLADLSSELADAKLEVANLKVELAKVTSENSDLREQLNRRGAAKPKVDRGAYMFPEDDGHYCTACYDVRGHQVRLSELQGAFERLGRWQCPACQAVIS
jgi:hypothetical protein